MQAREVLKQTFGYDSFREGQEPLIEAIASGRDALGVMPTGAGKSVCYQIPALLLPGIAIVVSPLISLMKDQVYALTQAGVRAAYINSSLTGGQCRAALANARRGQYKIVYVAPERLLTEEFIDFAQHAPISLLTVDEAHCISQWGQDFRPSYLKIADFIRLLPQRPVVCAFTATATRRVRADIVQGLALQNPQTLVTGFDRQNLFFSVLHTKDKLPELLQFIGGRRGKSGIVYCATRKAVTEVCRALQSSGFDALPYHAGLGDEDRSANQEAFVFDRAPIVVATNAFGMGIDKSNVSYVVHYNMPKDIESYYQEAGRAGRDGNDAECLLLYEPKDVNIQRFLIEHRDQKEPLDPKIAEALRQNELEKLKQMTFYCHTKDCLRQYILRYFDEPARECRDNCGNCQVRYEPVDITIPAQKILSCVYRMGGRYDVGTAVEVLRGVGSDDVRAQALDKLTTFGIMEEPEQDIRDMIGFLIEKDYLVLTREEPQLLQCGPRAFGVLRDRSPVSMAVRRQGLPGRERQSATASPSLPFAKPRRKTAGRTAALGEEPSAILLSRLKKLRLAIAREQMVPPFVIFTDACLNEMCSLLPRTKEELLDVPGVGRRKLERYGDAFLSEIAGFLRESRH